MTPGYARYLLVAFFTLGLSGAVMGQVSIEPPVVPTAAPADQPAAASPPASTQPAAAPRASTLPSAASVLQGILRDKPPEDNIVPSRDSGSPIAQPVIAGVAPNQPPAKLLREGDSIYNRTGRLVRDEKTGTMIFAFDADGKQMADPPMGVVPCLNLAQMEDVVNHGSQATKFRISGEITVYRGKNYIYPKAITVVKDLNQGLGAGGGT